MPPRRSTRASNPLPTPAASTKASSSASTASTPAMSSTKGELPLGLETPASLTDGEEVKEEEVKAEFVERQTEPGPKGRKRKASASTTSSPFTSSPPATARTSRASSTKYVLESVSIPSRRSKLGQEITGSADNLTLESPTTKLGRSSSGVLKSEDADEDDVDELDLLNARPAKRSRNTDTKPSVNGKVSARGKGKAKAEKLPTPAVSDETDFEVPAGDDFAMDSDEEELQLKRAIEASTNKANGRAQPKSRGAIRRLVLSGSSRSTSAATSVSGRGKGKQPTAQSSDGEQLGARGMRAAVLKAAEKRRLSQLDDSEISSLDPPTRDPSSSSESGSEFGGSDISDDSEALTEISASEASVSDEDDEGQITSRRGKPLKASPRDKGKGKGKGKAAALGAKGRGRRLGDGEEVEDSADMSDDESDEMELEGMDEETRIMTIQDMKEKRRAQKRKNEEKMKPIKEEEKKLSKELGRKLTNGEKNLIRLVKHHPELDNVWGDLQAKVTPVKPVAMDAHPSLKLQLLPFQKESLYWMKKQEEGQWKGGMLADEMGMGKTIQTIALLLSEPRRKPSLVVAPVVALMQWKHEIENNSEGFTVCLWHGQGRMKSAELKKFDVVLVSYGTLEASFRRQQRGFKRGNVLITEKSPMHEFEWYRVILDEAHNIKERTTNAAKAAFALQAKYKWCLSGTPLQNRVGELYSLVRFLGADPFSHYFCKKCDCKSLHWKFSDRRHCDQCKHKPMDHVCFWNTEILTPIARYGIESGNPGHTAFKKLKVLLDRMMLRRTKLERADDLGLPPRTIVVRRDFFSKEEKELYMSLFTNAKRQFSTYINAGTVLNNYSNIFSLITRMRQMACHPDLVLRSKTSTLGQATDEGTVCRICSDTAEDAIVSQCKHVFDRECIRQYLEVQQLRGHRPECPVCHIEISIDLEQEAVEMDAAAGKKARQGILSRLNLDNWRSSSKLEALVEELEKLRAQDCTIKSLVFSQFVSFLDLIAFRLQRAGFNICRLEGGMTPQQRDATIQHFMKNSNVTVFLISLKAGGVALNLTEASMVFMMDSWWNPSVEYQAMDRIHRLGQKRPVKVVKLVVEDSIEDQIVQLQHKKLAMTEAALSTDPDAALGKLTVEDLGFLFKM
ncbi:hypothetical protein EHS25_006331 [Saitozyma podzolica]|uniref:DNA repair protein rad16 n=1 Tax=Saitozyma podzolica TaxID=1890683 RepID=A0A427YRD8_9TREE|nr:hypothetical protein EHS25_006331 [Saitozyma podzolica]